MDVVKPCQLRCDIHYATVEASLPKGENFHETHLAQWTGTSFIPELEIIGRKPLSVG